jgi:hypothetical protein
MVCGKSVCNLRCHPPEIRLECKIGVEFGEPLCKDREGLTVKIRTRKERLPSVKGEGDGIGPENSSAT